MKILIATSAVLLIAGTIFAAETAKTTTVKGYVLDSACAFTKGLKKPISAECAGACAKGGSPLVILGHEVKSGHGITVGQSSEMIYWPIADTTPSSSQNDKLLPYAGKNVIVSGKLYERGGSNAIVISNIEEAK
jgi:hypothetical protein